MNEAVRDLSTVSDFMFRRTEAALALLTVLLAALIISLPRPGAASALPPSAPPLVQRRTLPSGLRVIVAEQPGTGLVALDLRVRAGSGAETPETSGTAHFIEHLLFKGTDTRKPGETDRAIEMLGGELTAQTTRDMTRFATVLPAAGWRDALAVLADMAQHPAFRAADVTSEKKVIQSEMAISRTEPLRAGFSALAGVAFAPDDPYRLPLMGSETTVAGMTPDALRTFWRRWYRPANMTLTVAGNVHAAEVFEDAARLWPLAATGIGGETKNVQPPAPDRIRNRARLEAQAGLGLGLTTVFVGFRAPSSKDADAFAAVAGVVSLLAGGAEGSGGGGLLAEMLRDPPKIALGVTADIVAQRGDSLIVLTATGRRLDAAKLETALRNALQTLSARDFTRGDAVLARQYLLAARSTDSTVEETAARLALADTLELPDDETDDPRLYAARLNRAVTPDAMTQAARRYLAAGALFVVVTASDTP